jgi:DNA-binding response OmpR family regulator
MVNLMTNSDVNQRGRILVADDDDLFRDGLVQWLERHGYECVGVSNAQAAISSLQSKEFDALISDIRMPGNAGLELIEQVPQVAGGLPVFLLTGRPSLETAARSVRLSVSAYLTKPPNFEELDLMLREAVARHCHARLIGRSRSELQSWDAQLEGLLLELHRSSADENNVLADYLQVTLRNVLLQLADLERTTIIWRSGSQSKGDLQQLDLIGALRRTVDVLEQTKQNFKSKQLADLRHQLEELLKNTKAAPGDQ